LHRGNHSATETEETPNYVASIRTKVSGTKKLAMNGTFCKDSNTNLIDNMNEISKEIWNHIKLFTLTLTSDGRDYIKENRGCAKVKNIPQKVGNNTICERSHSITKSIQSKSYFKEQDN
jgi:hypothetical protein